jgi:alanine racemase
MQAKLIISIPTLLGNLQTLRTTMPNAKLYPVVKGNGYGFDLLPLALAIHDEIDGLCVGLESEAITLANDPAITKPVLLMSPIFEPQNVIDYGFIPSIESMDQLSELETIGKSNQRILPFHLKLETGLYRFGLSADQLDPMIERIKASNWTCLEGVFSHFQSVKSPSKTNQQLQNFLQMTKRIEAAGIKIPNRHIANGEAAIDYPETQLDLVRIGNALYGKAHTKTPISLKKPDRLDVPVLKIQEVASGLRIGYGGSYQTKGTRRIGLIPFGFEDGLNIGRKLAPLHFKALIRELGRITVRYFKPLSPVTYKGKSLPLLGREYMQYATIDLTQHPEIEVGTYVQIDMSSFFVGPNIIRIYE